MLSDFHLLLPRGVFILKIFHLKVKAFSFCIQFFWYELINFSRIYKNISVWFFSAKSQIIYSPCFCSLTKLCPTLLPHGLQHTMFPVLHCLPEFAQTHVHWTDDAIQTSHPLWPSSTPAFNLSQHQGLFLWVCSSHHMAKVLELQLQHQSFQWIARVDFL